MYISLCSTHSPTTNDKSFKDRLLRIWTERHDTTSAVKDNLERCEHLRRKALGILNWEISVTPEHKTCVLDPQTTKRSFRRPIRTVSSELVQSQRVSNTWGTGAFHSYNRLLILLSRKTATLSELSNKTMGHSEHQGDTIKKLNFPERSSRSYTRKCFKTTSSDPSENVRSLYFDQHSKDRKIKFCICIAILNDIRKTGIYHTQSVEHCGRFTKPAACHHLHATASQRRQHCQGNA